MTDHREKKRKRNDQPGSDTARKETTNSQGPSKVSNQQSTQVDPVSSALVQTADELSKRERKQARAEKRRRKEEKRLRKEAKASKQTESAAQNEAASTVQMIDPRLEETNGSGEDVTLHRATPSNAFPEDNQASAPGSETGGQPPRKKLKKNQLERSPERGSSSSANQKDAYNGEVNRQALQPTPPSPPPENAEASGSAADTGFLRAKGRPSTQKKHEQLVAMNHAEILATKWLKAPELKALAEENGITWKMGPFTFSEKSQIRHFLEQYRAIRGLTEQQLSDVINASGKNARVQYGSFWKDVAMSVPGRPLISVHAHVKRAYEPTAKKGPWTREEDDDLRAAFVEFGPDWTKVAIRVDRSAADCKDRWRNHVAHSEVRKTGSWSKDEAEALRQCVLEMAFISGLLLEDTESGIPWATISAKLGNVRGPAQCRIKWTDDMLPTLLSKRKTKWNASDSVEMLRRLIAMNPGDTSEIRWHTVPHAEWNAKSGHVIHKNFNKLVKGVPNGKQMPMQELLQTLLVQARKDEQKEITRNQAKDLAALEQAQATPASILASTLAHQSRYKSKATIDDSDPDATDVEA
ncbi:hypothetical protein HD553DRAFT_306104 [Filobasidium floriforme]|uniref:uncharacterized protein n=1 Tax=Filobasidium floriforme TaxID=5210 RepID=UPI001E8DAA50|nr:uncharacterized protein HD553DRAFT_306104 [Filobasidium floriforme]KAH8088306.1 hypothetical protein HD553DRAFT_306104 [Filobasidium floriforme]